MKVQALLKFLEAAVAACPGGDAEVEVAPAPGELSGVDHVSVVTDVSGTGKTTVRLEADE